MNSPVRKQVLHKQGSRHGTSESVFGSTVVQRSLVWLGIRFKNVQVNCQGPITLLLHPGHQPATSA